MGIAHNEPALRRRGRRGPGQPEPAPLPPLPDDLPPGWRWHRRGVDVQLEAPDGWTTNWYYKPERAAAEARRRVLSQPKEKRVSTETEAPPIRRGSPVRLSTSSPAADSDRQELALAQIRRDGGTQARQGNNEDVVEEYTAAMREERWRWHDGNALTVFFDGEHHWLGDGFHRCEAASRAGLLTVPCEVRQGSRRDAVLFACGANDSHGLRRTRQDVRRAIEILLRDEEWGKWSNAEIARRVGCSDMTVGTVRKELESTSQIGRLTERVGADGRVRQAARYIPQPATPDDLAAAGFLVMRSSQKPGQVKLLTAGKAADYYASAPAAAAAARERIKERSAPPARPANAPSEAEYFAAVAAFAEHGYTLSCAARTDGQRGCPPYWVTNPKGRPQHCERWSEVAAAMGRLGEPAPDRILLHRDLQTWQQRAAAVGCVLEFDGTGYTLMLPSGKKMVGVRHGAEDLTAHIKELEAAPTRDLGAEHDALLAAGRESGEARRFFAGEESPPAQPRCFDCKTTEGLVVTDGPNKFHLCLSCRISRGIALQVGLSEEATARGWTYRNQGGCFKIEKNGMFIVWVNHDPKGGAYDRETLRLKAVAEIESRVAAELPPVAPPPSKHPPCKDCGVTASVLIGKVCEGCYMVAQAEQWAEGHPEAHWRLKSARDIARRDTDPDRQRARLAHIADVAAELKLDLDAPAPEPPNPAPVEEFDELDVRALRAGLGIGWKDGRFVVWEGRSQTSYSYYPPEAWAQAKARVEHLIEEKEAGHVPPAEEPAEDNPMARNPDHERRYDRAERALAALLEKITAEEARLLAALLIDDEEYEPGDNAAEALWVLWTSLAHQNPVRLAVGLGEAQL